MIEGLKLIINVSEKLYSDILDLQLENIPQEFRLLLGPAAMIIKGNGLETPDWVIGQVIDENGEVLLKFDIFKLFLEKTKL